jgi:hypothetical protein
MREQLLSGCSPVISFSRRFTKLSKNTFEGGQLPGEHPSELGLEKYVMRVVERLRNRIEPDETQGEHPLNAGAQSLQASRHHERGVPDYIVRLTSGLTLLLAIKGMEDNQDKAKHDAARRWISAVNKWSQLVRWQLHVCRSPQTLEKQLLGLIS